MDSMQEIEKKFEKWVRLVILFQKGGDSVCKRILHAELGAPKDGEELYQFLKKYETEIKTKNMPSYEKRKLLPNNDKCVDTKKLDIPAKTRIIEILDINGKYTDIEKLRNNRNDLLHMGEAQRDMSDKEFNERWDDMSQLLARFSCDMASMNSIKSMDIYQNQEYDEMVNDFLLPGIVKTFLKGII